MDDIVLMTRNFASKTLGDDIVDGFPHALRVKKKALALAAKLGGDIKVIEVSAYLHDIALESTNISTHAIDSANNAAAFLKSIKCPQDLRTAVQKIIKLHERENWDLSEKPKTIEEKIIYDAETAESLTTLGLLRHISTLKDMKYTNEQIIKSLDKFISQNHDSLFFDHTKNMVEYDYRLVSEFIRAAKKDVL
ncbi:MAG: HD domain-containing protein [Candidatus Aenigmarchaeota archaeon]|nr:HD domain-containing protein [Candidatus Aenigmarchaeota archaeon]